MNNIHNINSFGIQVSISAIFRDMVPHFNIILKAIVVNSLPFNSLITLTLA